MSNDGMLAIVEFGGMWERLCRVSDNIRAIFVDVLTKEQLVVSQ